MRPLEDGYAGVVRPSSERMFSLILPPDLERLSSLRDFVDSVDLSEVLSPSRVFDLKVATSEAVANAIEHAEAQVKIWLWLLSDRVVVEITNEGSFGTKTEGQPSTRRRGFGLRLMVSLADEVAFVGRMRGLTTVRLTFFRDVPRQEAGNSAWLAAAERRVNVTSGNLSPA